MILKKKIYKKKLSSIYGFLNLVCTQEISFLYTSLTQQFILIRIQYTYTFHKFYLNRFISRCRMYGIQT